MRSAGRLAAFAALCALAAAACSSSPSGSAPETEAGTPADGGTTTDGGPDVAAFTEAPHDPLPVLPNGGGPILAAPKLVTITYAGFTEAATMKAFGDWIVGSSWLTTVGHDYGVGHGSHVAHVVLAGPAPAQASDLDTQALLEAKLGDGTLPSAAGPDAGAGAGDAGAGDYL